MEKYKKENFDGNIANLVRKKLTRIVMSHKDKNNIDCLDHLSNISRRGRE